MFKELLISIGLISGPYAGMSVKDGAFLIYVDQEKASNPNFTDRTTIYDHNYNPGTLNQDGTTVGKEGSEFEYLWWFYQDYKTSMPAAAKLTVMARWEREAIKRGAR